MARRNPGRWDGSGENRGSAGTHSYQYMAGCWTTWPNATRGKSLAGFKYCNKHYLLTKIKNTSFSIVAINILFHIHYTLYSFIMANIYFFCFKGRSVNYFVPPPPTDGKKKPHYNKSDLKPKEKVVYPSKYWLSVVAFGCVVVNVEVDIKQHKMTLTVFQWILLLYFPELIDLKGL